MNSVLSFIIVLGILIFVHEFGHFIFAKLFKVKVLKFSLGFGPKMAGKKYGETEYVISSFPLGGYVKMLGEQPTDEISLEDENRSFALKPVWQRFIIVAAGPLFNLAFSVLLFFLIFSINGLPQPVETTKIGVVASDSPAERGGLQVGDEILSINGTETHKWADVSELIKSSGANTITLKIRRGEDTLELKGKPEIREDKNLFGEKVGERLMLGITRADELVYEKVSLFRSLTAGFTQTWTFIYLTILGIIKMIQSVIPASELGGPILIAQLAGQQMEAGWVNFLYFMALISVNLGILNLFPIPILDGGHLFFFSLEAIRRKPLSLKAQEICQQVGLVLLGSLMIFVFYNDLVRLFFKG